MRSQSLKLGILAFFVALLVGLTHRATTFFYLVPAGELSRQALLEALCVGCLSDLWVASLIGIVGGLIALVAGRLGALGFVLSLTIGAAAHQAYVEFFRFPIVPAHVQYLVDRDFLAANAVSILTWGGAATLLAFFIAVFAAERWANPQFWSDRRARNVALGLACLALVAHNRNIRWRVQWFVPEHVQMSPLEALVVKWKRYQSPTPLSEAETAELATALEVETPVLPLTKTAKHALLTRAVGDASASMLARAMRAEFQAARAAGRKPLLLVVLMESQRPAESVFMPRLKEIAATGVSFTRAFSTGSVTRGGQEAVACGYLGGRDTSLMRGSSMAMMRCLPEKIAKTEDGRFIWLHGGEGRFDGQVGFWKARGAAATISEDAFPPTVAATGWGKSDRAFFARAGKELAQLKAAPDLGFGAALLLSVSNHIPWELPTDAPPEIAANPTLSGHPSHRTTQFADFALGEFVDGLHAGGAWDDTLLIVVSDHGNRVAPRTKPDPALGRMEVVLQSQIVLVLGGGIVTKARAAVPTAPDVVEHTVSQADVAALSAYVLGFDGERYMGEDPFLARRTLPVLSDLEEDVFVPEIGIALSRDAAARPGPKAEAPRLRFARLYYRLFLDYIAMRGESS